MTQVFEVKGLDELINAMDAYPRELAEVMATTMSASLNTLWENVPPYPQQDPMSKYQRTGLLGKSFGSGEQGGASGQEPDVYKISNGSGMWEGRFGSRLEYAEYVVGENQAGMHASNWWNIQDIAHRAADKIERLFNTAAERLAAFLDKAGKV